MTDATVIVCGMSHKTSPVEERERVSVGGEKATREALGALLSRESVGECVIVSTCNRVEVYAACVNGAECFDAISEFLCGARGAGGEDRLYFLEGAEAARHLFRVSAGLDSMVVGEPQILGQLRRAYETARAEGATGAALNTLFQSAFSSAKKIKNETGIGSHAASVSSVAIKLARNIFGDISSCSVMVVGTGEAAADAAAQLAKRGAGEIRIAARDPKEGAKLAAIVGGKPVSMAEIGLWIRKTDIVISATGSSNYILKTEDLEDAMKLRKNKPVSLIDIAVPRDIDPAVRGIGGVFLYDMDDLQNFVEKNRDTLRRNLGRAEEMAKNESLKFTSRRGGLKAFPLIVELRKKARAVVREETVKTLSKLDSLEQRGGEKERRERLIWQLSETLMEKFLHAPMTKLKMETANSEDKNAYAETVKTLFDLSGELSADEDKDRKQG